MMFVILNPRFKKTYFERKEFESLFPRLINATVMFLKKLMNEIKMFCGADESIQFYHIKLNSQLYFCACLLIAMWIMKRKMRSINYFPYDVKILPLTRLNFG